jgi:sugar lactone lactonase YvrE
MAEEVIMSISKCKIVLVVAAVATTVLVMVLPTGAASETGSAAEAGVFPAFIPMPGLISRGVAVDKVGNVYVCAGEMVAGVEYMKVWKFMPDGEMLPDPYADMGQGTIGGLAISARGDLYVAMAAGAARGVWRIDREGQKELLPGSERIFFANGLVFDDRGDLYITESVSMLSPTTPGPGGIWRIRRGGEVELCLRDALLSGTGVLGNPVPIGANGIGYSRGHLFVTNTEKGTVLWIPIWRDGSLGLPQVWATLQDVPESPLAGASLPVCGDGLVLDVFGNVYVAVLTRMAVVRINPWSRSQKTVAAFLSQVASTPAAPFDFPASLYFGTGKGERMNLFVTNLGLGASKVPLPPPLTWPGPGLVKIKAGVPGRPLH